MKKLVIFGAGDFARVARVYFFKDAGHDVFIDDHCFISSHVVLSGNVQVGRRSFLGVNACVRQGVTIAEDCLIGAGAVILKNTRLGGVYLVKSTQASPVSSSEVEGLL